MPVVAQTAPDNTAARTTYLTDKIPHRLAAPEFAPYKTLMALSFCNQPD
jgi:hypothetical protein